MPISEEQFRIISRKRFNLDLNRLETNLEALYVTPIGNASTETEQKTNQSIFLLLAEQLLC